MAQTIVESNWFFSKLSIYIYIYRERERERERERTYKFELFLVIKKKRLINIKLFKLSLPLI